MSFWGASWGLGNLWGTPAPGPDRVCEQADERVLIQMDDRPGTRNFREFVCVMVSQFGVFQDVLEDIRDAFDVDTAAGVQLDMIGGIVGLPRQGFEDIRYRTFLKIQIDLLLSASRDTADWTGTHNNILNICRTFIGPGVLDPVVLQNLPPYAFQLSVPGVTLDEMKLLVTFICKAIYAGVFGQVFFVQGNDSLWDSESVGPITDGWIWCSESVVVDPCATWGLTVGIGDTPC